MKGLLYKDWLMLKKYCRVYLLVLIVFLVISVSAEESIFFSVYLMVLSSVLGVTLVSYDEKSGWERYCDTLPCPRELRVNEKYVFSLILMGAVFAALTVSQVLHMQITGSSGREASLTLLNAFICGLFTQGRIIYFVVIFAMVGLESGAVKFVQELSPEMTAQLFGSWLVSALPVLALLIFLGSWRLSLRLYRKRVL